MKKILLILLLPLLFISCGNNTIDKEIKLDEYKECMDIIKGENKEYLEADFIKADELFNNQELTKRTYRQLLNDAKTINDKAIAEMKAYNEEMDKLKAVLSVSVVEAQYFEEYTAVLKDVYKAFGAEIDMKNLSDKDITGVEGVLLVKNGVGEVIKQCVIELADAKLLAAGTSHHDARMYPVDETIDNLMELKAGAPNKYQYKWEPKLIIFSDGSRIKAPQKPLSLTK